MDEQITLRLSRDLARALAKAARTRRVPKSQVVREALARYVAEPPEPENAAAIWERVKHYVGSAPLDHDAIMADPVASEIYRRNWRP